MAKLGLIGAGTAARIHAAVAGASKSANIARVGSSTVGSAEPLAADLGVKPARGDDVAGHVDAVVVATPTADHATHAIAAISSGRPALIEAPLAWTLEDADAIIAAATEAGVSACYAENLTAAPLVDAARAQVSTLDGLAHLGIEYRQPRPSWRTEDPPLRAVEELGPRAIALALLLAGEHQAEGVRARIEHSTDSDTAAHVEIRCTGELIVTVDLGWSDEAPALGAQAANDSTAVRLELLPVALLEVNGAPTGPAPREDSTEGLTSLGYTAQLDGFAKVVERSGGRVCPAGFGRAVLELTHASYASDAADQREVRLPYRGARDVRPHAARISD